MSRLTDITQSFDVDIAAELAAKQYTKQLTDAARAEYGSSRLPVTAGPFAMQDRRHPESHVAWADVSPGKDWDDRYMHVAKELPAYPTDRVSPPRDVSRPHDKESKPDDTRIVHPAWPPKAPASLSARTEQAARDFDACIRNYMRAA